MLILFLGFLVLLSILIGFYLGKSTYAEILEFEFKWIVIYTILILWDIYLILRITSP